MIVVVQVELRRLGLGGRLALRRLLLALGVLRLELRPGRLVLGRRGRHVGAFGLQDLAGPQYGQHAGDLTLDLADARGVVELAGGELEAQVEQLAARLAQTR